MTSEEGELVGDHGLELGPLVDVEVIDTRVGPQLSQRGAVGGGDRRRWPGHPVGLPDAEQPGAVRSAPPGRAL